MWKANAARSETPAILTRLCPTSVCAYLQGNKKWKISDQKSGWREKRNLSGGLEGEKEPVRLQIQESQKVPSGRRRRTANAKRQGHLNTEAEHGS